MLLMPAWSAHGNALGVKLVNVFPGNTSRGLPAVQGLYVLMDGRTGAPVATMDGARLTLWRTAAASALAARFLARQDASRLLMVGAGALAPFLIRAHASVRPIRRIQIWNRSAAGAEKVALQLRADGLDVCVAADLEKAVREADVISCATLSADALIAGAWLQPGQHVDLVGAFTMGMREVDDAALHRARVFVDTPAALSEGGDVAIAIASGMLKREAVAGDFATLCAGAQGREADKDVTIFKAVGAAIEDLACAVEIRRLAELRPKTAILGPHDGSRPS